jgi:hypothetical protein
MPEVWTKFEGQVVGGVYPLRRFLGKSTHSVAFLTECVDRPDAVIKLVPEDATVAETQLSYWNAAATLSHPHLIRILDVGRCRLSGHPFLFLVMEYADETLGLVLPQRALTGDEAGGMLPPVLEALAYVHANGLVHGQLTPPNILVVGDQVKLASDNLHPAGQARLRIGKPSPYDPPEARSHGVHAAGDVWGLGLLVCEALTRELPSSTEGSAEPTLPESLPMFFRQIVRRCLNPAPERRPSLASFRAQLTGAPEPPPAEGADVETESQAEAAGVAEMPPPLASIDAVIAPVVAPAGAAEITPEGILEEAAPIGATGSAGAAEDVGSETSIVASPAAAPTREPPAVWRAPPPIAYVPRRSTPWAPVAATLLAATAVAGWLFLRSSHSPAATAPTAATNPAPLPASAAPAAEAAAPAAAPTAAPSSPPVAQPSKRAPVEKSRIVVHQEVPILARRSRATLHGIVEVDVRVTVDPSGKVVDEALENHGSDKYLELLSTQAARKWRFAANEHPEARAWLLQFEFSRSGTTASATPRS